MKRIALIVFILCGCALTPPAKVATAPAPAPDCKCIKGERCPDLEAEMDRGTPGCTSPEALEPLQRRQNIFEDPDVKRIFAACGDAAYILPTKCPNQKTKVTVRVRPLVCHWDCGQGNSPRQPQHGPWKLTGAEIEGRHAQQ